jgi:hypothetical protein
MTLGRTGTFFVAASVALTATSVSANETNGNLNVGAIIAQQTYIDVVGMLETSGYRVLDMKSTFLGRVRIRAKNHEHVREVVVSRSTGEIKSDQIIQVFGEGTDVKSPKQNTASAGSVGSNGSTIDVSVGTSVGGVGGNASVSSGSISVGSGGIGIGN